MSRKDLSRTVIEGGRYYRNCWERRESHRKSRASTRAWIDTVTVDVAIAEESTVPPLVHVGKSFRDKLAPAYRWIDAQVGRPWSKVHSELCARFDSRTVAGAHVLYDHMLKEVAPYGRPDRATKYGQVEDWYVDPHGILRKTKYLGVSQRVLAKKLETWRAGRHAVLLDQGWFWVKLAYYGERCVTCYRAGPHAEGKHVVRYEIVGPLKRGEVRYLKKLPDWGYHQVAIARDALRSKR